MTSRMLFYEFVYSLVEIYKKRQPEVDWSEIKKMIDEEKGHPIWEVYEDKKPPMEITEENLKWVYDRMVVIKNLYKELDNK